MNKGTNRREVTPAARARMEADLAAEFDLYEFVRRRFQRQKWQLGLV